MTINLDDIIKKSSELQSSKKFNCESKRLKILLDQIIKEKNPQQRKILSEWYLIRLVILWEYHFKSLIIELIDSEHFDYDEDVKLSLNDLKRIQNTKDVTTGKIFVSIKSLQNLDIINKILSKLMDVDFLTELKKMYRHEIDIKNVNECLEKRHQIIHEMKDISISKKQLEKYAFSMMMFMFNSSFFVRMVHNDRIVRYTQGNQSQSKSV